MKLSFCDGRGVEFYDVVTLMVFDRSCEWNLLNVTIRVSYGYLKKKKAFYRLDLLKL